MNTTIIVLISIASLLLVIFIILNVYKYKNNKKQIADSIANYKRYNKIDFLISHKNTMLDKTKIFDETFTGLFLILNNTKNKYLLAFSENIKNVAFDYLSIKGTNENLNHDLEQGDDFEIIILKCESKRFKKTSKELLNQFTKYNRYL
ncbi:MAG: hypothetical protein ACRC4L_03360 [Mycoplasma sp.]